MPVAHNKAPTEPAGETLVPLARSGARSPRNAKRKRAHKKSLFSLSSKSCRRQREQIERYTKTWRRPICTQPQEPPWAARGLTGRYLSKWSRYFPAFTQVPNQKQTATRNPPDRCFLFLYGNRSVYFSSSSSCSFVSSSWLTSLTIRILLTRRSSTSSTVKVRLFRVTEGRSPGLGILPSSSTTRPAMVS